MMVEVVVMHSAVSLAGAVTRSSTATTAASMPPVRIAAIHAGVTTSMAGGA